MKIVIDPNEVLEITSYEDFNRDYESCICTIHYKWRDKEIEKDGIFERISFEYDDREDKGVYKIRFATETSNLNLKLQSVAYLEFLYPNEGYINFTKWCGYYSRIGTRQWRRGFNGFHGTNNNLLCPENLKDRPLGWVKLLGHITNPSFFPIEKLIKELQKGKIFSGALDKDFAISLSKASPNLLVYYRDLIIGEVEESGKINIMPTFAGIFNKRFIEAGENE